MIITILIELGDFIVSSRTFMSDMSSTITWEWTMNRKSIKYRMKKETSDNLGHKLTSS